MSKYEHIFFDLDHTLWDFETNSRHTLNELFHEFVAHHTDSEALAFIEIYERINHKMWADYSAGRINKTHLRFERFPLALQELGLDNRKMALEMNELYMKYTPYKTALFPDTREVLAYLGDKYELHLITNGFEEVVQVKMTESDLWSYFKEVIISEVVGILKPHPGIFERAMELTGAQKESSIFIGDNLISDIGGARNFGMDQVFFNPKLVPHSEKTTFEISALSELKTLF